MSFRRIPFQFSSTDPSERQRELEKRFGLPSKNKMYVENMNHIPMGSGGYSSPRLQHRVPIFIDGYDQPNRSSVDSRSETKKPNVRVIPIEVEGAETVPSTRHRTFSGPAGFAKECTEQSLPPRDDMSPLKRSMQDLTKPTKMKTTAGPKIFNIPIKVEGADSVKDNLTKSPAQKVHPEVNGCDKSKHVKESRSTSEQTSEHGEEQKMKININNAMKKIENILEEFKSYEYDVKEFSGTAKDKQYRYLDEMLTRCMLRLDDIDTMGNENVRSARKNAVKQVQMCIDMLETKISSIKETEKNQVSGEVQGENIFDEEAKLKENRVTTGDQMPVSELSDNIDKAEVKDVQLKGIARSETRDCNNSVNSTQVEPSQDATISVSEIKAGGKFEDSNINVDIACKVSEVTDVEMVEAVNPESIENKSVERSEESVTSNEGSSCNLGETEIANVSGDSRVTLLSEVDMKEVMLEGNNSENVLEVEMSECPEVSHSEVPSANPKLTVEVSQEKDVEMTLSELKDKAINAGNIQLQSIPNKETENSGTDTSVPELCETQTDCHELQNITETVSSK